MPSTSRRGTRPCRRLRRRPAGSMLFGRALHDPTEAAVDIQNVIAALGRLAAVQCRSASGFRPGGKRRRGRRAGDWCAAGARPPPVDAERSRVNVVRCARAWFQSLSCSVVRHLRFDCSLKRQRSNESLSLPAKAHARICRRSASRRGADRSKDDDGADREEETGEIAGT